MLTKQLKRGDSSFEIRPSAMFPYISKIKIPSHKTKFGLKLNSQALKQQIKNRIHASVMKFDMRIAARDDRGLELLAKAIKSAKKVQTLDLDISSLESLAKLHKISEKLKGLSSLKSINIDLSFCYYLDDSVVFKLGGALKRLSWLQSIKLNFSSGVHRVTDSGMFYLSKALRSLPLLKNIHLKFSLCHEISDIGIAYITRGLKRVASLKGLAFNFFDCPKLVDKGLHSIGDLLKKHTDLKKLQLDFQSCNDLTDVGVEYIINSLKGFNGLQNLDLSFFACDGITKETQYKLREFKRQFLSYKYGEINDPSKEVTVLDDFREVMANSFFNDPRMNFERQDEWISEDEMDFGPGDDTPLINRPFRFNLDDDWNDII